MLCSHSWVRESPCPVPPQPSDARRRRRPPRRRATSLGRAWIASAAADGAPSPMRRDATSRSPASRSTTAGARSRSCRRSRPTVTIDATRKIITRNESPDISFDRSINPYRGCEHGCVYCFARPTHAYLGLSPGLDFESKLFAKPDAPALLERELSAKGYEPRTIAIGTNTDPYQPIERAYEIMRGILRGAGARRPSGRHRDQVGAGAARHRHPVAHGEAQPGQGRALGDDARPPSSRAPWSRAPRRRRGGSRRCGSCRAPACRPP